MQNTRIVELYLQGLQERLSEEDKQALSYARGATTAQLNSLKKHFPACPASLLELLSRINGTYRQQYGDHKVSVLLLGSDVFEYPYYLKSVEQILQAPVYNYSLSEIYDINELPDLVDKGIDPDVPIGHWLSFADCTNNGGTSRLFLDFHPAAGGTPGQVIRFLHDPDSFRVIASSFDTYLEMLMNNGYNFIIEEEE